MVKVLIVDDDKIIRNGIITIIRRSGISCDIVGSAQNGRKALEMILELNPDIVITDIKMPIMDGIELVKNIKSKLLSPRIVVLSGFDDYKYVRETMRHGAVDYLLKPVNSDELITLIKNIINDIYVCQREKEKQENDSKKLYEGIAALKEKFLKILIWQPIDIEWCLGNLKNFNMENTKVFLQGIISIDDNYKFDLKDMKSDNLFLLKKIKEKFQFICNEDEQIDIILLEEEENIIFMVLAKISLKDELEKVLYNKLSRFKSSIKENFGSTITIGISRFYDDILKTSNAYEEAKVCMDRRFYEGKDKLITFQQCYKEYDSIDNLLIENQIQKIINSIEICSACNVKSNIETLFDYLSIKKQNPKNIRKIVNDLVIKICRFINNFQYVLDTLIKDNGDIYYCFEKINTFRELKEYTISIFCGITERMKVMRSEKSHSIIEIAKNYIKTHYSEEVNLKIVAQQVYLNPNYFSELFKQETGKNFIDYLMEIRIEMAKEFLKKPGMKVYEVAGLIGYKEVVSFNRAFKKVVGVSPREYLKLAN